MDTKGVLDTIARFLGELGYESADHKKPTANSMQATIESLAKSLEEDTQVLQVGSGGITLSREEGRTGPLVARIGLFDVELERVEKGGRVLLTSLSIRQPGEESE